MKKLIQANNQSFSFKSKIKIFYSIILLLFLFSCEKGVIIIDPVAPKLTFDKLSKNYTAGGQFTTAEIFEGVKGNKKGYTLKKITNLEPNNIVVVSGSKPTLSLAMRKVGLFTATLTLKHTEKPDATVSEAQFEVLRAPAETLTFTKRSKVFSSGGSFSVADILGGVQGTKTGYTVKNITTLNPTNLVTVSSSKELNFSGGVGSFTATIILQHPSKADATITNCAFEITNVKTWEKAFADYGEAKDIVQNADGSYTFLGSVIHPALYDIWVVKLNADGNKVWDKKFGETHQAEEGFSIFATADGGYVVLGFKQDVGGNSDIWVIKLNSAGDKVWDKTFGDSNIYERAFSIVQTTDGGYALAGFKDNRRLGKKWDFLLIKTDSNGNEQWKKTFDNSRRKDYAEAVVQTRDGGYAITGRVHDATTDTTDAYVVKTDASGNKIWDKTFSDAKYNLANDIVQTMDGGYAITGHRGVGIASSKQRYDIFVIKMDANGNKIWDKTFGGTNTNVAYSIEQTTDGGYVVAGETDKNFGYRTNAWIIKTDANGNKLWDKSIGEGGYELAYDIIQAKDGGYVIAGTKNYKVWVVKLDKNGNL